MTISTYSQLAVALFASNAVMAGSASGDVTETDPARIICQAAAGRYERVVVTRFAENGALAARFRLLEASPDRSYAPAAGFLYDFGQAGAAEVHVTLFRRQFVVDVRPPRARRSTMVARAGRATPVEVAASLAPNGILTVSSGRRSAQVRTGGQRPIGIEVTCQSGRFEIELLPQGPNGQRE